MAEESPYTSQELIDWQFIINQGAFVVRYGTLGPLFYKQFLPAGIPVPLRYPPKRIDQRTYNFALRQTEPR